MYRTEALRRGSRSFQSDKRKNSENKRNIVYFYCSQYGFITFIRRVRRSNHVIWIANCETAAAIARSFRSRRTFSSSFVFEFAFRAPGRITVALGSIAFALSARRASIRCLSLYCFLWFRPVFTVIVIADGATALYLFMVSRVSRAGVFSDLELSEPSRADDGKCIHCGSAGTECVRCAARKEFRTNWVVSVLILGFFLGAAWDFVYFFYGLKFYRCNEKFSDVKWMIKSRIVLGSLGLRLIGLFPGFPLGWRGKANGMRSRNFW